MIKRLGEGGSFLNMFTWRANSRRERSAKDTRSGGTARPIKEILVPRTCIMVRAVSLKLMGALTLEASSMVYRTDKVCEIKNSYFHLLDYLLQS